MEKIISNVTNFGDHIMVWADKHIFGGIGAQVNDIISNRNRRVD